MLSKVWNLLVLICAAVSAAEIGVAWHNGEPAWWFVWLAAIWFCIDVALIALKDLVTSE